MRPPTAGTIDNSPPPQAPPTRRWWRRKPALLGGAAALVTTIAVAIAAALLITGQDEDASSATSTELWLTAADDPGQDPFMPPAGSPPSGQPLAGPELAPQGDGTEVVGQQLPGDRRGLYGGSLNNSECDREKMIAFLETHPAEASAFVAALNADSSLRWSQGTSVSVDQIGPYIRELTPAFLRVDTRVTNHGFDGTNPIPLQSILQAGTAVLVDTYGVPRVRCYCGNPLTAPVAFQANPEPRGTPWPGYNPGAFAVVEPAKTVITVFVMVDIYTGVLFERTAGRTGEDRPLDQPPVAQPSGGNTAQDGSYVSVGGIGSTVTIVVRDGRIVSMTEEGAGAGACELAIKPDFVIGESERPVLRGLLEFCQLWPIWCIAYDGTMSGQVTDGDMTVAVQGVRSPYTLELARS